MMDTCLIHQLTKLSQKLHKDRTIVDNFQIKFGYSKDYYELIGFYHNSFILRSFFSFCILLYIYIFLFCVPHTTIFPSGGYIYIYLYLYYTFILIYIVFRGPHIFISLFSSLDKEKHCRSLTSFKSIARAEMNTYKSTIARIHRFVQNVEVISEFD